MIFWKPWSLDLQIFLSKFQLHIFCCLQNICIWIQNVMPNSVYLKPRSWWFSKTTSICRHFHLRWQRHHLPRSLLQKPWTHPCVIHSLILFLSLKSTKQKILYIVPQNISWIYFSTCYPFAYHSIHCLLISCMIYLFTGSLNAYISLLKYML